MKITRKRDEVTRYCIDGKNVTYNALNEFCKKFLSEEGLHAMWRKVISSGECTLDLDVNCDENKLLEQINAELQLERAKNAALEKKLMQLRIKAAKYDCLVSAMKST